MNNKIQIYRLNQTCGKLSDSCRNVVSNMCTFSRYFSVFFSFQYISMNGESKVLITYMTIKAPGRIS